MSTMLTIARSGVGLLELQGRLVFTNHDFFWRDEVADGGRWYVMA